MRRFRPNIVVNGASAFAEDTWTEITFDDGSNHPSQSRNPSISLVSKCTRCLVRVCPFEEAVAYSPLVASKCRHNNRNPRQGCPFQGLDEVPHKCRYTREIQSMLGSQWGTSWFGYDPSGRLFACAQVGASLIY